jgi:glucose-1-phosphate cytidylyltransferase
MELSKVPVFILAGGMGTRISEETVLKPKPMIEIGEVPIIVHLMRWYHSFGFNDFVICGGYKSWEIKDYFLNYQFRQNNLCIDHRVDVQSPPHFQGESYGHEKWRVRVIDTGLETMTGGRVARAFDIASKTDPIDNFAVTYGDGLTDADLGKEFAFHSKHGKLATMLGVKPLSRFGELDTEDSGLVRSVIEKPESKQALINGGFFFFKKEFRNYLDTKRELILERGPLEKLVHDRQMMVYEHNGFWQCMDTLRDKTQLQEIWDSGKAPWKSNATSNNK